MEDFWLRVHSLVRELVARLTDYEHLDTARRDRIVRGAGRRLNAAHDAEELTEVLVDELPKLGIPSCYLAMYGSEGEREEAERQGDERAWSRTLLVYEAGRMRKLRAGRRSFRSRELAPTARLGSATPSGMVAMPLYFQERQLGFALFEVGPRLGWVYGDLQEQLSSALHSALLIEREHRALAALKQAHGELEQRVALRTAELATANEALARLVDEQAALRRVATLVAKGVPPAEMFAAVSQEVGRLFDSEFAAVGRFDPDGPAIVVVGNTADIEGSRVGSRFELEEPMATAVVYRTGRSARFDHVDWAAVDHPIGEVARHVGTQSTVASPITVEGRLWGAMAVSSTEPMPRDAENRLEKFAELLDTAIAGVEARTQRERLAEEQAALRRVATLVARQSSPEEVLRAVAEEVAELLGTDGVGILRFEPDGTATQVAQSDTPWEPVPLGTRFPLEGESVVASVLRTGKTARLDDWANASGRFAERARSLGIRCSVATPIVVAGRLWGTMVAVTAQVEPLPADTESRLTEFTELVATAISNAQVRTELAASRARLAAAADDERRRVVRDLHDGAQQRLVHTVITMKLARRALDSGDDARPLLAEALAQAEEANVELRELAHGILPAVLASGGLRAVVEALASRTPVPIDTAVSVGRLPAAIEATAYFVVAEALTNVAKHARAKRAQVSAHVEEGELRVKVRDDGVGGARSDGSGLVGLGDRIAALDGRFQVESPAGGGTLVTAYIPLPEYW